MVSTVQTSVGLELSKGQHRVVFRNPRTASNERYYVVYSFSGALMIEWSSDGSDWTNARSIIDPSGARDSFDVKIRDTGTELHVYLVYVEATRLEYRRLIITDTDDAPSTIGAVSSIVTITDGITGEPHACSISRTANGRLVVAYTDDSGTMGNVYRETHLIGSDDDSAAPTWSGDTTWDDPSSDMDNAGKGALWMATYPFSGSVRSGNGFLLCARLPDGFNSSAYNVVSAVPEWNGTAFSNTTQAVLAGTGLLRHGLVLSCLVDSSDFAHIIYRIHDLLGGTDNLHSKKGATAGDDDWGIGVIVKADNDADAASLTIDTSASPEELYAFYHDAADSTDFHYKISPVDTIVWAAEQTITIAQDVDDGLSTAQQDQANGIHIAGQYGTTVFYHEITLVAGPQTLTPAPVVASFSVPDPVIVKGGLTLSPAPTVASFVVPAAVLQATNLLTPSPVVASFVIPDPVIVKGGVTLVPASVVSSWIVPAVVLQATNLLAPGSAVASFNVPDPVIIKGGVTMTPGPVITNFIVPDTLIVKGGVTMAPAPVVVSFIVPAQTIQATNLLTPTPVVASFVVPEPVIVLGAVTLTPAPTIASFVVPAPTIVKGGVTMVPAPVVSNWVVPTATIFVGITLQPGPVVSSFAIPDPTITIGAVTLLPASVVVNWVVPAATIIEGGAPQTLTPVPVVANFVVPDPVLIKGGITISPVPVSAAWVVPDVTIVAGATLLPAPVVASFVVPDPAIVIGGVVLSPPPVIASWNVPTPTLVIGGRTLLPSSAIASFVVPSPTLLSVRTLTPGSVQVSFSVPAPDLLVGGLTLTPLPAIAAWGVPDVTMLTTLIDFGSTSGFRIRDIGTSDFETPDLGESDGRVRDVGDSDFKVKDLGKSTFRIKDVGSSE